MFGFARADLRRLVTAINMMASMQGGHVVLIRTVSQLAAVSVIMLPIAS